MKPIKVIKESERKIVDQNPKDKVKSLMVKYKRKMRTIEAEMLRELQNILLTLK